MSGAMERRMLMDAGREERATNGRRRVVVREVLTEVTLPLIGLVSILGIVLFWPFQP